LYPNIKSLILTNIPGIHILANYMLNKNFHNWCPKCQIITTLYDHDKNQNEKLLSWPKNKFFHLIMKGNLKLQKINKNDDNIIVKNIWYCGK
jgi:hypothetical protein